ncbi:hypothetical protein D3C81_288650 [compost metagenome]
MPGCCADAKTGTEQFRNAFVQIVIDRPTLVLAGSFGLFDTLGLALAALLVILARNGCHHFYQHRVDSTKHPPGELIALRVLHSLMTGG